MANNDSKMVDIVGRKREIKQLEKLLVSRKSEFLAVYGRRRVGKTFLIREHFEYKFDFHLTGMAMVGTDKQLLNFHTELSKQFNKYYKEQPKDWFEAFQRIMELIEAKEHNRKKIIFLDEMPWLDTAKSDFISALEHFWNSWATYRKDIILIACGSAASWMINKLINERGGLHNRVTVTLKIEPFTLKETEIFLQSRGHALNRYQIVNLYMVMGGIPFYLEALSNEKSSVQNIEEICFKTDGLLRTEFIKLFASLFKKHENHMAIVEALSTKTMGLTRSEVIRRAGLRSGGQLTNILEELEESGFIKKYTPFGKKAKYALYRLSDFYTAFYFKFIKPQNQYEQGVWTNSIDNPVHRAWAGFAFEQVCLSHIQQIKKELGISGILSQSSSWKSTKNEAQIDLVIDRRDQVINLCEIKYSIKPYKITKKYAENLRNKIGTFKEETKTKKAVFQTMITTYGVERNEYSYLVQNDIKMDALFEKT